MANAFRWALRVLKDMGYVVCPKGNHSYEIVCKDDGLAAIEIDPEITELINMKSTDISQIVYLARKIVLFKASV